jgi:hypothetical protein
MRAPPGPRRPIGRLLARRWCRSARAVQHSGVNTALAQLFEHSTIQAIPTDRREGSFRYLFTIWFGCNMSLLTVITGALATTTFGLGFVSGCCAIVLGLLVGTVFMALHAAQGPQMGLPQMVQTRGQFGALGALLVLAAVILMYVGFIASNLVLGAQSIHSEVAGIGIGGGVVLLGSAGLVVAVFGYDVIHGLGALVSVATGLALLAMAGLLLASGLPKGFFAAGVFSWSGFVGLQPLSAEGYGGARCVLGDVSGQSAGVVVADGAGGSAWYRARGGRRSGGQLYPCCGAGGVAGDRGVQHRAYLRDGDEFIFVCVGGADGGADMYAAVLAGAGVTRMRLRGDLSGGGNGGTSGAAELFEQLHGFSVYPALPAGALDGDQSDRLLLGAAW